MLELAINRDYTPGITNTLGFEPLVPRADQLPKINSSRKTYDKNIGLFMHLAAMDARVSMDPKEATSLNQFISDADEWMDGFPRLGLDDFDVKSAEEFRSRVAAFKEQGPLERIRTEYVRVEPSGFLRVRHDIATLVPCAAIFLFAINNGDVRANAWQRTVEGIKARCEDVLPQIKADQPLNYAMWAATSVAEGDADDFFIEECTNLALNSYQAQEDLTKIITDKDRMTRWGFDGVFIASLLGMLASGFSVTDRTVRGGLDLIRSRRKNSIPAGSPIGSGMTKSI